MFKVSECEDKDFSLEKLVLSHKQDIYTFFKVSEYEDKVISLEKLVLSHKQDIDTLKAQLSSMTG